MMPALQISCAQAQQIAAELIALGELLEAQENPLWVRAARAAAVLDGLRLGVAVLEPHPFASMEGAGNA